MESASSTGNKLRLVDLYGCPGAGVSINVVLLRQVDKVGCFLRSREGDTYAHQNVSPHLTPPSLRGRWVAVYARKNASSHQSSLIAWCGGSIGMESASSTGNKLRLVLHGCPGAGVSINVDLLRQVDRIGCFSRSREAEFVVHVVLRGSPERWLIFFPLTWAFFPGLQVTAIPRYGVGLDLRVPDARVPISVDLLRRLTRLDCFPCPIGDSTLLNRPVQPATTLRLVDLDGCPGARVSISVNSLRAD